MENLVILAIHLLLFAAMQTLCRAKPHIAQNLWLTVPGIPGVPVFALLVLAMLDFSNHAGQGTHGAWYVIFSVLTLGILPLMTLGAAACSSVLIYRCVGFFRKPSTPEAC